MKRFFCYWLFACLLISYNNSIAQSTTNQGTDFWTAWMKHIDGTSSKMSLYLTGDIATTGKVEVADGSFSQIFSITPNNITVVSLPTSAYLNNEALLTKGIHVTALKPVVVYAHIYNQARSGATLVLPVAALAKDYYTINYTQLPTSSNSDFCVIATEDNTTVEITPTAALVGGTAAGQKKTITLNKGQLYQGLSTSDLTGTHIKSVSSGSEGCKKIAVYSGSSFLYVGAATGSGDNLFQQLYPVASWGKNFITAPLSTRAYDVFRIAVSDPSAKVTLNGNLIAVSTIKSGFYYEIPQSSTPNVISSDKPIQVVQYATTQGLGNSVVGDPEMIFLSPIEQGLDHVTLYSPSVQNIVQSYVNVILSTSAVSSFKLDGIAYTNFKTVPGNTAYSYAQITVSTGTHTLSASTTFNAIAYGFGSVESYGYAAGTNLKNLNQYVLLDNPSDNSKQTSGCVNTSYNLQVTTHQTTSIKWDFKDGSPVVVQTNPTPVSTQLSPDGTQTLYTYQYPNPLTFTTAGEHTVVAQVFNPVADDCGSYEDIQFDFSITDFPVPGFTYDNACIGTANQFTDKTDLKGSTAKSWLWDFGDGTTSTLQNPQHTYATMGEYDVKLTVTNANGCQATSGIQTVHISPIPVAAFQSGATRCPGQSTAFTDKSTVAEGAITQWLWDFGDGGTSTLQNPQHTYNAAGDYDVKLTVITSSGCSSASFTQAIHINKLPVAEFPAGITGCAGGIITFTNQSASDEGAINSWSWDFGDGGTSVLANPAHVFVAPGDYTVKLTVTSVNSCTSVVTSHTVHISALPTGQFVYSTPNCAGQTVTFTDQSTSSEGAITSWAWDFNDGNTSVEQNPQHVFANSGDYNVQLTVTTANGCSSTSFVQQVHINKLPIADFQFSSPDCDGQDIIFTDRSIPNEGSIVQWLWDFSDGGTSTQQNPRHKFSGANTYNVTLKLVNSTGCESIVATKQVIVHPLPVADFIAPDVCLDDAFPQFMNSSTIADGTEGEFTYVWNFGDPAPSAGFPNVVTDKNPKHRYKTPRDASNPYHVTLTVTSKYGCVSTITKDFVVNGSKPVSGFTTDPSNTYCSSNDVIFVDQSSVDFGKVVKLRWYFDVVNKPNDYEEFNTTTNPLNADGKYYHNYGVSNDLTPRTFTVKQIAYSGDICEGVPVTKTVTIYPDPVITLEGYPGEICLDAGTIQVTEKKNGFDGSGVFSGNGITPGGLFDPQKAGPGKHTINYTFTANGNGCTYNRDFDVMVYDIPVLSVKSDVLVLAGGKVALQASATSADGSSLTYHWSPSTGLNNPDVAQPEASPLNDTKYTLTVTSSNGCVATGVINVKVLRAPVVPNTFTPNYDGVNDTWKIENLETYPNSTVEVFNRNGERVFYSLGYPAPWDGRYNGYQLPVGVYYYIINPKNGRSSISGYVTIIR